MKSTILLTTALFLASAPSPNAKTISEFSAGFLAMKHDFGLMASTPVLRSGPEMHAPVLPSDHLTQAGNKLKNRAGG
jgi:hypothetical protein